MLQSCTPLFHKVILLFDIITSHLDKFIDNTENLPTVQAAAQQGHTMMNKYYGLTDDSIMYHIAMCEYSGFCLLNV